jgi:ubiquinone/menaquinone biosynthesis C-methylase UbiE
MPETLAPEHFRDWNEHMIQRYDPEIFHHHPRGIVRWVERKRVAAVKRNLAAKHEHRILDVGCGAGNILEQIPGRSRHGIDLSAYMVKRARERLWDDAQIVQGDAEQLPYADQSFDCVIASSLLSHVLHPEQVLKEVTRVTRIGGRVVISISHEDQIEKGLRWVKALGLDRRFFGGATQAHVYTIEYHLHRFSLKRLRSLIGSELREINLTRVPFIFPVHWIAVYERVAGAQNGT